MILTGDRGTITLIDGLTFAISDALGDIVGAVDGLVCDDTRRLSRMRLSIDGTPLHPLGAAQLAASTARFRGFVEPVQGPADPSLEVERRRTVMAGGLIDEVVLRWWGATPASVDVRLELDADFVDIFAIRGVTRAPAAGPSIAVDESPDRLTFTDNTTGLATLVKFNPVADGVLGRLVSWTPELHRGTPWRLVVSVETASGSGDTTRPCEPAGSQPPDVVVLSDPPDLGRGCRRALADLDALSMPDRLSPGRRLIAAGIPWFVALFGRDSLIAGHQARAFLPGQIMDTLWALAVRQGRVNDPGNEEAPGKILHEVRLTPRPWLGEGTASGARPYFGSIDATPLFLILLGTAMRWGASRDSLRGLLPAARAALGWLRGPGDPDGDGLLEYHPTGPRSLSNQSWKDSADAVQFADGRLAEGPIAMVEVQGYAYRARRELAGVLRHLGHDAEADRADEEARALRKLIRGRFWCEGTDGGPGHFALALDGKKHQVAAVASNMGHLLWCDVPSQEEATQVARHLTGPALSSGWGLRTLSSDMSGFNPISYHVGSVWPHDGALACEGLRRYDLDAEALALADDLIAALILFDHRLPELFGGHAREPGDTPTPYPAACRPQAWAAGVPLQLATMFLGLEPDLPNGRIRLRPQLPSSLRRLEVRGCAFPTGVLSVEVDHDTGIRIVEAPRSVRIEVVSPSPSQAASGPTSVDGPATAS